MDIVLNKETADRLIKILSVCEDGHAAEYACGGDGWAAAEYVAATRKAYDLLLEAIKPQEKE